MKRKVSLYIQDILQHMTDAEMFVQGQTQEHFSQDKKTLYAVLRAIEVIGEAAKRIPTIFASDIRKSPGEKWQGCGINSFTTTWA